MARTPIRAMRIPNDIWQAAQAEAARRGESVTAVVVRALIAYTGQPS